jgi:hypothetical protein
MQSPWQTDFRDRKADLDFIRSERSTSAPPPETSLIFGTRNDGLTISSGGGRVDVSYNIYMIFFRLGTIIDCMSDFSPLRISTISSSLCMCDTVVLFGFSICLGRRPAAWNFV